jgi:proline iminopeptidase
METNNQVMPKVLSAIACNLDAHILSAALPLFEAEKVQAIEWSFDVLFKRPDIPNWFWELIQAYSQNNRLIGHGVFFSLFLGKWQPEQTQWLAHLKQLCQTTHFDHITEHFGFMTGADFHKGAPLSIPFDKNTLNLGIDRLQRIQAACQCPVGLENLAFAYSYDEVKKHGDFLAQLVESINGFIILDLHNLYCQLHNFDLQFDDIINRYPLDKVREIHISGGSWDEITIEHSKKQIRRDTHDNGVPHVVFELLIKTLPKCPNLKYVVLEQLGTALYSQESQSIFQNDFLRLDNIVSLYNNQHPDHTTTNLFLPPPYTVSDAPIECISLYGQQQQLSHILENASDCQQAQQQLAQSTLANTAWQIEKWQPTMIETARQIAQKWKNGWSSLNTLTSLILVLCCFTACEYTPTSSTNKARANTSATYFATDTNAVQDGGIKIIPIKTPKGEFKIWTKRIGNNPKAKVLLLNGGPGCTHEYFECLESFFPAEGIEFIYYDQLGCGNSDNPNDTSMWDLPRFVEEVEQVRTALNLNKDNFYLLGHSWGGILGIEYALKYQQNLKALIVSNMMSSCPEYGKYADDVLAKQMPPAVLDSIRTIEAKGDFSNPRYMALLMPHFYAQHICRFPVGQFPDPVNRALNKINQSLYVTMQGPSEFGIAGKLEKWDRTADLKNIQVPTLTIGGKYDTMDPAYMEMMSKQLPKGSYLYCANGSHFSMYDDQQTYMKGLIKFIKSVE